MIKLFDAHSHLQKSENFQKDYDLSVSSNVKNIVLCSVDESDWTMVQLYSEQYDGIYVQYGIHPWHAHLVKEGWEERLEYFITQNPKAAIGECGLDKSGKHKDTIDFQMEVFIKQIELAVKYSRPISVHCVHSWRELFILLKEYSSNKIRGLIHSFNGSKETVKQLVTAGLHLSVSPLSLKNISEKKTEALRSIPSDRILIETDFSGSCSTLKEYRTSAGLINVLHSVADIRHCTIEELAEQTFGNSLSLLDI